MKIKLTQHIDLPPMFVCPTCLKTTPFQAGEHWQVCEEHHFTEVRGLTFANGEARRAMVAVDKPPQELARARRFLRKPAGVRALSRLIRRDQETNAC